MFGGLGVPELLILLLIVLLFFGAKRLPEIGKSLGEGIREFKDSIDGMEEDDTKEIPGDTSSRRRRE
jgi:sec-independent protein translocase protein TatA